MKKILCLTDFSKKAHNGILYANELAKKLSSTLTFMHTYNTCEDWHEEALHHPSQISYSDTESRDMLSKICMDFTRENKYSNVDYGFITREGEVQLTLNQVIADKKIDLVVLSMEGLLSPTNTYYGNVISGIVQNTKCPVIVVPSDYKFNDIRNIVYAFDMAHENTFEKVAVEFARAMGAHLDILHYSNKEDEEYAEALYAKYNSLKIATGYNQISLDVKASKNIIDSLQQFTVDRNTDMLILEHHKKVLYEQLTESSFTRKFIFFSKIPVMVIRSKES